MKFRNDDTGHQVSYPAGHPIAVALATPGSGWTSETAPEPAADVDDEAGE